MSKMGRAVLWVQENGLEDDPKALSKYTIHLTEENERNIRSKNPKHGKDNKDITRPGRVTKRVGQSDEDGLLP
jgi:hypothetical protein